MTTKVNERRKFWAWVPAMLVIAGTIVTAAGISVIPSAIGATATEYVDVQGIVDGSIAFAPASCSGAAGGAIEVAFGANFTAGGAAQTTNATPCAVTFNTNNINGATLTVNDANAAPFFCTATCAGNDTFDNKGAGAGVIGDGEFGMALTALAGNGTPAATAPFVVTAAPAVTDPAWVPITAAPQGVCATSGPSPSGSDAVCTVSFGADPKAAQTSGTYDGQAVFVATTI